MSGIDGVPAPGDLQRVVDELETSFRNDPELIEGLREVFRSLNAAPFDPTGSPE